MCFSTSSDPRRHSAWGEERSVSFAGRGESVYGYSGGDALPPENERAKTLERVSHRQRRKHVLLAADSTLSGHRAEVWNSIWDKGVKERRLHVLEAFIYLHKDSNAATMEADLGGAASLLFTRLTSWLRLTYKTLRTLPKGGGQAGQSVGRADTLHEGRSGKGTRHPPTTMASWRKPSERRPAPSFPSTSTPSIQRLSDAFTPLRPVPPMPRGGPSRGGGEKEGGVRDRTCLQVYPRRGNRETSLMASPPGSFGRQRSPSYSGLSVRDGASPNSPSAPRRWHAAVSKGERETDGSPHWRSDNIPRSSRERSSQQAREPARDQGKGGGDEDNASRSALLLLLKAIIIFIRGLSFMTQFVEVGVASMLTDCLECGTQPYPLVEGAPVMPSPFQLLTKSERKHVVLLLLYLANAGRVYRELICDEAGLVKLFHALQREKEEEIGMLLTELFTSLGHGHPRMAPVIHSGLIRVILCHCPARKTETHFLAAGGTSEGGRPFSGEGASAFLSCSTTLASSSTLKGTGEQGGEEVSGGDGIRFPVVSLLRTSHHPPLDADSFPRLPPPPGARPSLPFVPTEEGGGAFMEKERPPLGNGAGTTTLLLSPTGTTGYGIGHHRRSSSKEVGVLSSSQALQKGASDGALSLHPDRHHPYISHPYSPDALALLERTISDEVTLHTARTLRYLQITMEEQHFALCQNGGAGLPGVGTSVDLVPIVGLSLPVGVSTYGAPPIEREAPAQRGGAGGYWRIPGASPAESAAHGKEEGKLGARGWAIHQASSRRIHPHLMELHFTEFLDSLLYLTLHENTRFRVEGSELLALAAKNIKLTRPILTRCFEILDNDMLSIADDDDKARIARRQRLQLSCGRAAVQIILSKPMSEERKTLIIHYIALHGAHLSILKYLRLSDSSDAAAVHDCCKALQLIARASHAQQRAELQQMQHLSRWMHSGDLEEEKEEEEHEEEGRVDRLRATVKEASVTSIGGALSPVLQMGFVIHDTIGDHLYQVLLHEELSEEESFAILRAAKSRKLTIPPPSAINLPP